jgi:uncharacterized protein
VSEFSRSSAAWLLIAGGADTHASMPEMQLLFDRAAAPKTLWVIPGAEHLDFHWHYRDAYEQRVLAFLKPLLAAR